MRIIGIDSGSRGAIVELDTDARKARYLEIPYRADKLIDFDKLKARFDWHGIDMIYIEHVRGRSGWGASSTFTFGYNYGLIRGFLYDKPHTLVTPQKWQKIAHLGSRAGVAKIRSLETFIRLCPNARIPKTKDGVIDAFHIARYGLFQYKRDGFKDDWTFENLKEGKA